MKTAPQKKKKKNSKNSEEKITLKKQGKYSEQKTRMGEIKLQQLTGGEVQKR